MTLNWSQLLPNQPRAIKAQASEPRHPEGLGWRSAFLSSSGKSGHRPPNSGPGYKEGKRNFKSLWLSLSFTRSFSFWPRKALRPTYLNSVSLYIKKTPTNPFRSKPDVGQAACPVGWQDGTLPRIRTAPGFSSKGRRRGWLCQAEQHPPPQPHARTLPCRAASLLVPKTLTCSLVNCFVSANLHYPTPSNITKLSSDVKAA